MGVASHVAWEDDGERTLVMDLRTGDVVRLDGTSRTLWLLADGVPRDGLVDAAATAYGVAATDVRADVEAWLDAMGPLLTDEP